MAKKTCKGLTYAKYSTGGNAAAVTYTGGKAKTDYLCKVDVNENHDQQKEYADGHQIDASNLLNEVSVALELANVDADIKKDILGQVASAVSGETNVLITVAQEAPFVGIGFILCNRFAGTETYEGYWFYKVQFGRDGLSSSTQRESIQWEHETINGQAMSVTLSASDTPRYYEHIQGESTEAAVRTWLNTTAGISSQRSPYVTREQEHGGAVLYSAAFLK